ncbi:MAG: hypothetical protein QG574_5232, partial [Cyanobacteriota bacterium erpe_2018_sw_21hr_WHONDRS-SW48-000092_B_bin.40]|nr:hypothetical protein [Cyanobacteriota bacterium erpe_2018_sw_21hr_WHONDRS-SW48-000092_B_bin.40]
MQKTQLAVALVAVLGLSLNTAVRAAETESTEKKETVKTEKKIKVAKKDKECKKECKEKGK